ncbi:MAG: DUF3182 family protein [Burkholderiales bacterium]
MTLDTIQSPIARPLRIVADSGSRVRHPVAFHAPASSRRSGHDHLTKMAIAEQLAALLEVDFLGELSETELAAAPTLLVPSETLVGIAQARRLGVTDAGRLFGGVVPQAFVATKVISHRLITPTSQAPAEWSLSFGQDVAGHVLPGFSAFSAADAIAAGHRLLAGGAVRLKEPAGVGGTGQHVIRSAAELRACVSAMNPEVITREGVVIERNLNRVATLSVGQVQVGEWLATYCGTQTLTRNHRGDEVYGGSRLIVARGDYADLLQLDLSESQRQAVDQAVAYHRAALACFEGLMATRANYDIAQGVDYHGVAHSGVLEQSWRIGGASGAELVALQVFAADPTLAAVRASTHEIYGESVAVPSDARVNFAGIDDSVGPLTKYARVDAYEHT